MDIYSFTPLFSSFQYSYFAVLFWVIFCVWCTFRYFNLYALTVSLAFLKMYVYVRNIQYCGLHRLSSPLYFVLLVSFYLSFSVQISCLLSFCSDLGVTLFFVSTDYLKSHILETHCNTCTQIFHISAEVLTFDSLMKDEKRSMIYFLSYLKPHPMGLVLIKDNLGFQVKFDMNTHY